MKKIITIVAAALLVAACSKTNLKIEGVIADNRLDNKTVYLTDIDMTHLDSTEIKKGKFSFKCRVDTPKIVTLQIDMGQDEPIERQIVLESGQINIKIGADNEIDVSGTNLNDIYSDFWKQNKLLDKKYENALNISEKAAAEVDKEYVELGYNFARNNPKNIVGKIAFLSAYLGMSIAQREEIISLLDDNFKTDKKIAKIISNIEQEKKASVGQPFIDFSANDINGKEVKLSSLVGQTDYLLIDFWASWCGPCRKALPSLKALYDKYKGKKFDIIGVSLDSKKEDWTGAIERFQLKWTNISDLKHWDSYPARLYAISFIPNTILLDKEGKIVGRNLHINEIEDILNQK